MLHLESFVFFRVNRICYLRRARPPAVLAHPVAPQRLSTIRPMRLYCLRFNPHSCYVSRTMNFIHCPNKFHRWQVPFPPRCTATTRKSFPASWPPEGGRYMRLKTVAAQTLKLRPPCKRTFFSSLLEFPKFVSFRWNGTSPRKSYPDSLDPRERPIWQACSYSQFPAVKSEFLQTHAGLRISLAIFSANVKFRSEIH